MQSPHRKSSFLVVVAAALSITPGHRDVSAEPLPVETIRQLTQENIRPAIALYREFLSLPNDANYPDDILRMVEWMEGAFGQRGFSVQRIATAGSPLLLAEKHISGDAKTVLIYLQSDGQPVDPSAWFQEDPYTTGRSVCLVPGGSLHPGSERTKCCRRVAASPLGFARELL